MTTVLQTPYDLHLLSQAYQQSSDLDFELRVHEYLKSVGCQSDHGGRYLDRITQKMREYDILAVPPKHSLNGGTEVAPFYSTKLAIECKNVTQEFPVVVGVRPYEQELILGLRLRRDSRVELTGYNCGINIARMHECVARFGQDFIEHIGVEIGQVAASGKGGKTESGLYDKWSQAIHHSVVRYGEMIADIARGSNNGDMPIWCPAVLVVPDDRLFIAVRGKSGVVVRATHGISVKVGYEFEAPFLVGHRVCISNYFVFTFTGLQRFVGMFK